VSRRLTEPAVDLVDLPRPDAVVLSHLHGDHWDRRTNRHLDHTVPVLTTRHAARRLRVLHGFGRTAGLRTWQGLTVRRGGAGHGDRAARTARRCAGAARPPAAGDGEHAGVRPRRRAGPDAAVRVG